jgi:uncharacterized FlaG/YvyC family protein
MLLGRLEMIDQAQVDHVSKISKIQESDKKDKVDPEEKYKNVQPKLESKSNEMILDNVKFGYNSDTNDFFVRITKGDTELQYPTEDMMKLKQTLMEAYKSSQI